MTSTGLDEQNELFAIADRLYDAVSAGDMETVRGCYSPDVKVWHNFDNREQTCEENLGLLAWVSANWRNFRFEEVKRQVAGAGYVQQHMMRGEGPDGAPFESPAIQVVEVKDGLIVRIDEYFDPSQVPLPQ
jgi:ketosteroid isomerase-like protein